MFTSPARLEEICEKVEQAEPQWDRIVQQLSNSLFVPNNFDGTFVGRCAEFFLNDALRTIAADLPEVMTVVNPVLKESSSYKLVPSKDGRYEVWCESQEGAIGDIDALSILYGVPVIFEIKMTGLGPFPGDLCGDQKGSRPLFNKIHKKIKMLAPAIRNLWGNPAEHHAVGFVLVTTQYQVKLEHSPYQQKLIEQNGGKIAILSLSPKQFRYDAEKAYARLQSTTMAK